MKHIFTIACLLLITAQSFAQSVFFEDFENGVADQFTQEYIVGTLDWVNDPTNITLGPSAASFEGDSAAHFYYADYSGDRTSLVSPTLDLSAGGYKLSFAHVHPNWLGDQNTLAVRLSVDNGATWTLIDSLYANVGAYQEVEYNLNDFASTTANSKLRFDGYISYGYAIGLDAVNVFLPPVDDAELTSAVGPVTGCGLGSESVAVSVYNNGLDTIFAIDGSYMVGATTETESFTVEIAPGQTDTLTFSVPADVSVVGTYDFTAWVTLTDDLEPNNDTVHFSFDNIPVIASLPYSEDFENGSGGWVSGGILNDWQLGTPATAFISTANSGVNAWVTNLTGQYQNSSDQYVESPCMDFSSLSVDPVFRFAFIGRSELGWDGTWIELSTDAGATWTTVGSLGEGTNWYNNADEHGANFDLDWWDAPFGGADEWTTATHLLDGAAGSSSVKVRVFFHSDISGADDGFAFDDVEIFEQPSVNAGVVEIISPTTGCGLGVENVTVVIQNFGDADLVDFSVEYDAGSGVVSEMITDTLFSATVDTFTFSVPVDLAVAAGYDFGAWTVVAGDGDLLNDSLFVLVTSVPVVSALPYTEDFESGAGGWTTGGTASTWELGDPQGAFVDTANSGVNAWVTNLAGAYVINEDSYLESPCFDFSALTIDPILEFAHIYETEECCDQGYVEISFDGGTTWTLLGVAGEGENWYNDGDNNEWNGTSGAPTVWRNAKHLLDGAAGQGSVKIRFAFSSDISLNYDGFGVDDISISEQPPINGSLFAINSPVSSCGLTATEAISVTVSNLGSIDMDSVVVSYSFDNGPVVTEVFNQTLAVGGSVNLTLSTTLDLSVNADYDFAVWVSTVGDGDTSNDTSSVVVTSVPTISSLPYTQDFESGTGGWRSVGVPNAWELGDPEGIIIDTAFSGVNAWATNLNTLNYSDLQFSVLTSPCFDFSGINDDPVISFAIQFDAEQQFDAAWMEVSADGGTTWNILGNVGEGENWYTQDVFYNAFVTQGWDGQSGGNGDWITAEHILEGVAGSSEVSVRFVFSADDFASFFEGFAVDDINIRPQAQLDLVALSFEGPQDGCSLGEESVSFTFWNKGLQTVSNFEVGFIVNSGSIPLVGSAQTETYTGSVATGDTVTYTFSTELADLSTEGTYQIDVFTALAGDENLASDTLFANEVVNFGESTPLSQTEMPGLPISSNIPQGTSSEIFFCGLPASLNGCLQIESLSIDSIQHTWLSDLDIYLISPAGDTVELSTDNGGSLNDMSNVVFSDTSSNDITLQTDDIMPGVYHTEDSLGFAGLYNGQDPNGAWTLFVRDDTGGDEGTLMSWSMTFVDYSPTPELAFSDTSICITQVLTVSASTYDSYLWSTGNNTQSIDLYGNVLGLGTHEIYVTVDQDGCTGVSNSFVLTVDACAGVAEFENLSVEVYPNPTRGEIVLDITGNSNGLTLQILDMNGKLVYAANTGSISSGLRKTVDLSGLASGMYFLKLDDGSASTTKKLIKE
ncbi:MAG: T9SS type A sorting domain-containing protein [Flavobacteriales bacterium]|nr:T9SS type A sorting domain-containing protein [Flavobacteriales bacterium]